MGKRYSNILETVGRTPVVKIDKLAPKHVNLYVKIEAFNPMGSVKDRLALGIIEDAERTGKLKPGQTVIESTSGNTGIGLAMVCAQKGYPLVVTMAESFSIERRKLMRFLGARVVLTPAHYKGTGMVDKAVELAEKHGWFLCRQFENDANPAMHSRTTAPEILEDFKDVTLDYWVTGYGTGGTLQGVARVLKEKSPKTRVVVCEPDNSPLLGSGVPQVRNADGSPAQSHPTFRPHVMQGWTPDFIPKITGDAVAMNLIDQVLPIPGGEALRCSKDLAQKEGIFVGISAGATFAGALKVAASAPEGANILCMLPDTGERYMTTPLFEQISEDMNEEEWAISKSTPRFRFDVPPPAAPAEKKEEPPAQLDAKAQAFVEEAINDPDQQVVLFAMEWCEFCWAARKLFAKCKIPYRSVDLDSVAWQKDDFGVKVRAAVSAKTGCKTVPQIFINGEFIGGSTDMIAAYENGNLQARLKKAGISFEEPEHFNPGSVLPGWLQHR